LIVSKREVNSMSSENYHKDLDADKAEAFSEKRKTFNGP
jgi:hypothetical protein